MKNITCLLPKKAIYFTVWYKNMIQKQYWCIELVQRKWSQEAKMDCRIMCIAQRIHTPLHGPI